MLALTNYLFYCFYCGISAKKSDRAEAAEALLTLWLFFTVMDFYTLLIGILGVKSHFFVAGGGAGILAHLVLSRYYFRPRPYSDLLTSYAQNGEPHRVRYALTGVGILLTSIFLPFLIMKLFFF